MPMPLIVTPLAIAMKKLEEERLQAIVQQARAIDNRDERIEWLECQRASIRDPDSLATVIVMSFDKSDRAFAIHRLVPKEQGEEMAGVVGRLSTKLPPPEVWLGTK